MPTVLLRREAATSLWQVVRSCKLTVVRRAQGGPEIKQFSVVITGYYITGRIYKS